MKIFILTTAEISADVLGDMDNRDIIQMALSNGIPYATFEGARKGALEDIATTQAEMGATDEEPGEAPIESEGAPGEHLIILQDLSMAWKIREMDLLD